jgi:3-oxoacyl-[acyl-carrier-protein] synthase-3
LAASAARLPDGVQTASEINQLLHRPPGWLERHAGIRGRRVWAEQDPLTAAVEAARQCLDQAGIDREEVGALLVTSEAPPLLVGLGAALHHRLDLRPSTIALELGGACSGFLAALWTAQTILPRAEVVLVIALECPSRLLQLKPGPAGEAAALFGDGVAACVLGDQPANAPARVLKEVRLACDGSKGSLLQVGAAAGSVEVHFAGEALAFQAVSTMTRSVQEMAQDHGLAVSELTAVVAHGGNGRLPGMLARQLGLPPERVWSETAPAGNLGSASVPAAWAVHQKEVSGPVIWTAVGAGLTWGAALFGVASR